MSFMSRASFYSASIERTHEQPSRLLMSSRSMPHRPSPHPVGERGLDRRTSVQRSQHDDRGDRGASKFGRDIEGDSGEAEHLDVQRLSSQTTRFEIVAAVVPLTEVQTLSGRVLLYHASLPL